jgi:hypothetical protein
MYGKPMLDAENLLEAASKLTVVSPDEGLYTLSDPAANALRQYNHVVPQEVRDRTANYLKTLKVRTFEDLTDVCLHVSGCLAAGEMTKDVAQSIKGLFEIVFTNLATKGRGEQTEKAGNALADMLSRLDNPKIDMKPTYTRVQQEEPVIIDIELKPRG